MNVAEAIDKLTAKVTSKDLPAMMKILKPEQLAFAMNAIAGSKMKNVKMTEDNGKQFIKSLTPAQLADFGAIVGKDLVVELLKAAK